MLYYRGDKSLEKFKVYFSNDNNFNDESDEIEIEDSWERICQIV
jgi:hypothetical protein